MKKPPATSWNDFSIMETIDPRTFVQSVLLQDQGGAMQTATFVRSNTWLHAGAWTNAPMTVTPAGTSPAFVSCPIPQDYASQEEANRWNALHSMTAPTSQYPLSVQKIVVVKAGSPFVNNLFVDWTPAVTSTDIQLSLNINSVTSGDFTNSGQGTIPVFKFPATTTYGGTSRLLQITLLQPGRYDLAMRIIDNSGY